MNMRILVRAGQVYWSRPSKPNARKKFVRVVRVTKGQQPKVTVRSVTSTGKKKPTRYVSTFQVWLTYSMEMRGWVMPSSYQEQ